MTQENHRPNKRVLTEKETAEYIAMSRTFLRQGRMEGARKNRTLPPPHIKIGRRSIRYLIEDLNQWLNDFKTATQGEKK